jgi:hypothetical protein
MENARSEKKNEKRRVTLIRVEYRRAKAKYKGIWERVSIIFKYILSKT